METDEARRVLPFQLQFDKPVASQNGTLRRICWRWSPKIPRFCCTASIGRGSGHSLQNEKVRSIPHSVVAPMAVSSSRGVACVLAVRKRVLVYILDEDEDEVSDAE